MHVAVKQTQEERQTGIIELIIERGSTRVEELSEHFNVSAMTLYRDLAALEARHIITRHKGTVSLLVSSISETPFEFRLRQEAEAKMAVGKAAAKIVDSYATVFLDDSTTAHNVIDFIADPGSKEFITNSLASARKIADSEHKSLTVLGGKLVRQLDAMFGPTTTRTVRELAFETAVFSTASIKDGTIFHPYPDVAGFKSELIKRVSVPILVATGSKFDRVALHRIADVADFKYLVVDDSISDTAYNELSSLTNVIVADR